MKTFVVDMRTVEVGKSVKDNNCLVIDELDFLVDNTDEKIEVDQSYTNWLTEDWGGEHRGGCVEVRTKGE